MLDRIGVRGDRSLKWAARLPVLTLTSVPAFAAIGHQESWDQIAAVYRAMRPPNLAPLTDTGLREVVPWIPPRTVTRFHVAAAPAEDPVAGIYIDTFITPDDLALGPTRQLLAKVHDGIRAAEREGARVATLGGFTSILLEAMAQPPVGQPRPHDWQHADRGIDRARHRAGGTPAWATARLRNPPGHRCDRRRRLCLCPVFCRQDAPFVARSAEPEPAGDRGGRLRRHGPVSGVHRRLRVAQRRQR